VLRLRQDPTLIQARVRGVPIQIHASAMLLPAMAGLAGSISGGLRGALFLSGFLVLLNFCGALHEAGHAGMARLLGHRVTRVRMSGVGMYVQVSHPANAGRWDELLIASGGPVCTALLTACLGWASLPALAARGLLIVADRDAMAMLAILAGSNLLLTVFNLLPVPPMDGAHMLGALLAVYLRPAQASRLVSTFGQATIIAILLVAVALGANLLILGTVWFACATLFILSYRTRHARPAMSQVNAG